MTKQILLMACFMVGSQIAFATTSMKCTDGQGRELSVQMNGVETVTPYYGVVFRFNGKVLKRFEVVQKEDSSARFMAETNDGSDPIQTVGYIYSMKQGFYQRSANGGMSPLPPLMFDNCDLN